MMRIVLQYLKPFRLRMLLGLTIKIAGTFADLGLPWVLAYILDEVIPYKKVSYILIWGMIMLGLAIAARELNIIANRMASLVARNSVEKIRHDAFEKILYLSGAQVDEFSAPSLISRMTSDTYNVHLVIGMMQRLGVRVPIILIGGIVLTATLDLILTLVLIATLPLLSLVIYLVSKKGIPLYLKMQQFTDKMVQTIRENIAGIRVIKALSKTEHEKQRFYGVNTQVSDSEMKAGSIMALSGPIMNLLLNLGLVVIVIIGAYRVNLGLMQPGRIVAFLTYFTMILNAMMMVNRLFVSYSKASASAKRIGELLLSKDELVQLEGIEVTQEKYQSSKIVFEQVSFSYGKGNQKHSVNNVNFDLKPGEKLGIIGSTGSGKTTLINLLMRFYDTSEGKIYVDGKDIRTFPLNELRSKFGAVFQSDMVFSDTLLENISFGRNLTLEEVTTAARQACAEEFILEKEDNYEFKAAIKGANLSGGQKQRLLISRALAKQPEILILDDSSSALDYKTDAKLREAIRTDFKDTTVIMIAQRVSSVMHMDQILVLEEGEAIGYGTHEALLDTCPIYREIYESQMGGGRNEG